MNVVRSALVLVGCLVLLIGEACSQNVSPLLLSSPWKGMWITDPGEPVNIWSGVIPESGKKHLVYKFRKTLVLPSKPSSFVVHVSADNRYKLFVSGAIVSLGPARGDLLHLKYETADSAPYLQAGENTIAALVWNEGLRDVIDGELIWKGKPYQLKSGKNQFSL